MKKVLIITFIFCTSYFSHAQQFRGGSGDGHSSRGTSGFVSLPIELIDFNAKLRGEIVNLNWSTGAEMNNDFFTIERSMNGKDFESLKTVKGAGNSSTELEYEAVDHVPLKGISYYRLKQTDFDGKYTYSRVISINVDSPGSLLISKNNTSGNYLFEFKTTSEQQSNYTLEITNSFGQSVYKESLNDFSGTYSREIDFILQGKGVYIASVSGAAGKTIKRIVVY